MRSSNEKNGLRVLVADDDDLIRNLIARIVARAGHCPHAVANGLDAFSALLDSEYNLAILDIRMPGMGAVDIANRFRKLNKQRPPIIALTADATPETAVNCLLAGINLRLTKPIHGSDLLTAMDNVLSAKESASFDIVSNADAERDPLDGQKLAQINEKGGFRVGLLVKFLTYSSDIANEIETAMWQQNQQQVADLTHKLQGCAGMLGARAVEDVCRQLHRYHLPESEWLDLLRLSILTVERELQTKGFI